MCLILTNLNAIQIYNIKEKNLTLPQDVFLFVYLGF